MSAMLLGRLDYNNPLKLAQIIREVSYRNDEAIKTFQEVLNILSREWSSETQKAYEECFYQMKPVLYAYIAMLEEYSDTLKKIAGGEFNFNAESEYANIIRGKFGGKEVNKEL